jgi:hypothetical protein
MKRLRLWLAILAMTGVAVACDLPELHEKPAGDGADMAGGGGSGGMGGSGGSGGGSDDMNVGEVADMAKPISTDMAEAPSWAAVTSASGRPAPASPIRSTRPATPSTR